MARWTTWLAHIGTALTALVLAHNLAFLATYGPAYRLALARSGHDAAWTAAVAIVLSVALGLLAAATLQLRRLARLAPPPRPGSPLPGAARRGSPPDQDPGRRSAEETSHVVPRPASPPVPRVRHRSGRARRIGRGAGGASGRRPRRRARRHVHARDRLAARADVRRRGQRHPGNRPRRVGQARQRPGGRRAEGRRVDRRPVRRRADVRTG